MAGSSNAVVIFASPNTLDHSAKSRLVVIITLVCSYSFESRWNSEPRWPSRRGSLQTTVNVSINVGQPNFYGRIDIGDFPPPVLIDRRPIIIRPVPAAPPPPPLYLRVPPGHARHWSKHCGRYEACGRPVYFVQDSWYRDVYVPAYAQRAGRHDGKDDHDRKGKGKPAEKHKDKD